MIERASEVAAVLYFCGDDIDFWVEELGLDLRRVVFPSTVSGALIDGVVFLRKGLTWAEEVLTVAHELCHSEFHATCVAFRELDAFRNSKDEGQAELFASLVLVPDPATYYFYDDYPRKNQLPKELSDLRFQFFMKHRL